MDMHHFARRTAAAALTLTVGTVLLVDCGKGKDTTDSARTITTVPETSAGAVASEAKIATQGGEIAVPGHILGTYTEMGGAEGTLGAPTAAAIDGPAGGTCQEFTGGAICWSDQSGAHVVWGDIRQAWDADGGARGTLGYPTSDEKDNPDGSKESDFLGGSIRWKAGLTTVIRR
jgi:uncharacterized protein with LGFP repeats